MRRGTQIGAVISIFATLSLVLPLVICTPGAAGPVPADANGVVYPLTSFLDWAENPLQNLTNPALGEYAGSQLIEEAAAAVAKQFPTEIATAFSADPGTAAVNLSEQMAAELVHLRPVVANDDVTDVANPNFLPDFDHNGVFGDPGDFTAMEQGAQGPAGLGSPTTDPATGAFLYPCIAPSGAVTYETTTNVCAPAGSAGTTYKTGLAEQETIVDARGLALAATRVAAGGRSESARLPGGRHLRRARLGSERLLLARHVARRAGRHRRHVRPGRAGGVRGQRGQSVRAVDAGLHLRRGVPRPRGRRPLAARRPHHPRRRPRPTRPRSSR